MEKMNENKDIFEEMSITELVNFVNELYNKRQSMDFSYSYQEEAALYKAMITLDKRLGIEE